MPLESNLGKIVARALHSQQPSQTSEPFAGQPLKPKKSACGLLAKYGPGPTGPSETPRFQSEAEEAQWWFDQRKRLQLGWRKARKRAERPAWRNFCRSDGRQAPRRPFPSGSIRAIFPAPEFSPSAEAFDTRPTIKCCCMRRSNRSTAGKSDNATTARTAGWFRRLPIEDNRVVP